MPVFRFFIDRKVSEWYRDRYEITAENQNIANLIMKEVLRENHEIEDYIPVVSVDVIDNTLQDEYPSEDGRPSRELYSLDENGNDTFIEGNGHTKMERR